MTTETKTRDRANDMSAVVTSFKRNLGNGVLAASDLVTLTENAVSSGNTNYLLKAAQEADKKSDQGAVGAIAFIVRTIWASKDEDGNPVLNDSGKALTGRMSKVAKTGEIKIKTANVDVDKDALARLRDARTQKLSIRGVTFKKHIAGEQTRPQPLIARDKQAWAESIVKSVKAYTDNIAQQRQELTSAIATLQAALQNLERGKPNEESAKTAKADNENTQAKAAPKTRKAKAAAK